MARGKVGSWPCSQPGGVISSSAQTQTSQLPKSMVEHTTASQTPHCQGLAEALVPHQPWVLTPQVDEPHTPTKTPAAHIDCPGYLQTVAMPFSNQNYINNLTLQAALTQNQILLKQILCPHLSASPTECTQVLQKKQSRGWVCPVWGRTNPNWNWRVPARITEPKQRLGSSKCEGQTWNCLTEPTLGLLQVFLGALWEPKCLKILLMPKALQRGVWKVLLNLQRAGGGRESCLGQRLTTVSLQERKAGWK